MNRCLNVFCLLILPILAACAGSPKQPLNATESLPADSGRPQEDTLYRLLLAEIAGQRGKLDIAVANLSQAAAELDDPEVAERATRVAIYAKDRPAALTAARRWLQLAPDQIEPLQFVATLSLSAGDADAATEYFRRLLAFHQRDPEQGFQLVAGLLSRERSESRDQVLSVMATLVEDHDNSYYAHLYYGELALMLGNYDLAESQLSRSLQLRPRFDHALILHARLLREQGRADEALKAIEAALKQDRNNDKLRLAYARLLLDAKRYTDAKAQFEKLLANAPDDADYIFTLALLTLDMNKVAESKRYLERLIELNERSADAYYYLGRVGELQHDYEAAIESYAQVGHSEYQLDAQIRIGYMLARNGEVEKGRQHLQRLRGASPEPAVALRLFLAEAELLTDDKRYHESIAVLSEGLLVVPGNTDLLYTRALLYEKVDRVDLLESDLRAVLLREPENAAALNALGYTLADRTDRYQEAYELIQQAIKLQPEDPAIIDSMGWVLYRLGRTDEAVSYLKRALTLQYDTEIAAHLGEVLWVMGHEDAAKKLVEKALEQSPDNEDLLNVKRQIDNRAGNLRLR